jgi:Flp pilus assembly protein TadB
VRRIPRLVFLLLLLVVLHFARDQWGSLGQWVAFGSVTLCFAIAWFLNWRQERRIRREVAALPLEAQIEAINHNEVIRDAAAGDVFGNERPDRGWQFTRAAGPLLGMLYLPVLYLIFAGRHPNGLIAMGMAVLGILLWRWYARRYVARYRCPRCGGRIPPVSLRPVRFVCVPCAITWRL